ncbi:GspH/FimT family pseudopilin [Lysobacter sp. A421]
MNRNRGFTLIELMVTIVVLAILLTIGLPSFQGTLRSNRVATTTNEMVASLALARSEAIKGSQGAGMCASKDGGACDGTWNDGWIVWGDSNGSGAFEDGEPVFRFTQGRTELQASGPTGDGIVFDARGRRRASDSQVLALRPVDCGNQPLQRTLTVNITGQVRTARGDCS